MKVPREIELKLELEPAAGDKFAKHLTAALGPPRATSERLKAVYYDTHNHALRRRGFALRVRQEGDRRIQTLKAGSGGAGMFNRAEWEVEAGPDGPDPSLFGASELDVLFKPGRELAPLFTTDIRRSTWDVREEAAAIEVVLDSGTVSADRAAISLGEVELELKSGTPEALFRLARRLVAVGPLRLSVRSKSDRGYELAQPRGKAAIKAEAVALTRDMNATEAFQAIARACLRHFRLNEPGVIEARDVEALHQVRVAIRRLRSAMSLFKPILTGPELPGLKHELRLVSRCLGEARNIDVYRAGLAIAPAPAGGEEGRQAELARLDAAREAAYDRVLRKLRTRRFRLFTLDLSAWIETGSWLDAAEGPGAEPVWRFAKQVLARQRRKVKRAGRDLAELSPAARHRVRIEAKKLRYAGEFFAGLVKGKKARHRRDRFIDALEALQDRLGELNDIETGRGLAGLEPAAALPEQESAAAPQAREAAALEGSLDAYRAFREVKPFWH